MSFFSIIIPTYNRAHIIEKTIDSVLLQSFIDFELLIVDDGSTDDTKELISSYTDIRIKYIYQENGERGKARNTGTKNAKGKYVFFLDSDDLLYPNHLEHAYQQLEKFNFPEFFHSRYELLNGSKKQKLPKLNPKTISKKIRIRNVIGCQFFLKKEVAITFPFSENRFLKIGEDWMVVLQVSCHFKLNLSNEITTTVVNHGNRSMEIASVEDILISLDILVKEFSKDKLISESVIRNIQAEFITLASLSAAIKKNKKQALKLLLAVVKIKSSQVLKRRTLAILKKIFFN